MPQNTQDSAAGAQFVVATPMEAEIINSALRAILGGFRAYAIPAPDSPTTDPLSDWDGLGAGGA